MDCFAVYFRHSGDQLCRECPPLERSAVLVGHMAKEPRVGMAVVDSSWVRDCGCDDQSTAPAIVYVYAGNPATRSNRNVHICADSPVCQPSVAGVSVPYN